MATSRSLWRLTGHSRALRPHSTVVLSSKCHAAPQTMFASFVVLQPLQQAFGLRFRTLLLKLPPFSYNGPTGITILLLHLERAYFTALPSHLHISIPAIHPPLHRTPRSSSYLELPQSPPRTTPMLCLRLFFALSSATTSVTSYARIMNSSVLYIFRHEQL